MTKKKKRLHHNQDAASFVWTNLIRLLILNWYIDLFQI